MSIYISTASLAFLWAILAIGVFVSYRVLNLADLSVEGSFPLGAAVSAVLIHQGFPPLLSVLLAALAGMLAGLVTGLMHTRLGIPSLLAGILCMTGLYSVNLRIMGKANLTLLGMDTLYSPLEQWGLERHLAVLLVAVATVLFICVALYWFFGTEIGMAIRASGHNAQMVRALGVNTDRCILIGLAISNAIVALSGALIAQNNGFADTGMGVGTIVTGLAAVIIGEVLFGIRSFKVTLSSAVVGSLIYRAIIALVLEMGLQPNDLKLLSAIVVALALSLPKLKKTVIARMI